MPKEQDEFENFPEDIEHPAKSLWEQLLKTFKDFLNLHPQNGDQSQSEEEKRRKEEEEEEEKQRRRLVGQLSSILLEFTDLHKTSSIPEPEWQMPGYMRKSHWGPDSEIRAFAEHFSNNSLVGSLDNLIDGKDLTTKENAYKELKQGIESFKAEKQENVPERDKSNSNFGLDQNTADQIRKMEKYLDDYIKGCRPDGNKNTAEFKEAEAKLKQTRKTMDNPYYSPDYQQPKSEYAEFDSFFNNFNNFGSTTNREKPYPKPSYNNDRQKTGYTSEQQNKEDKSKAEEDSIKNGGQFIKDNNLTDMLAKFLDPSTPKAGKNIAYRVLALATHPDKVSGQSQNIKDIANKIFKQLNNYKNTSSTDNNFTEAKNFLNGIKDIAASSKASPSSPSSASPSPGSGSSSGGR